MSWARLSPAEREKLACAMKMDFGRPVTAYLTNAMFVAGCCIGRVYHHVQGDVMGRFQDGHRIRTSDVMKANQCGEYWLLRTRSGSLYVVLTFGEGGRASLDLLLELRRRGMHDTPGRLQ